MDKTRQLTTQEPTSAPATNRGGNPMVARVAAITLVAAIGFNGLYYLRFQAHVGQFSAAVPMRYFDPVPGFK